MTSHFDFIIVYCQNDA